MPKQRLKWSGLLCFVFLATVLVFSPAQADTLKNGDYYVLSILHTNDIHGKVDKLPQYATLIRQARQEAKNLLVLDGGDIFLRGEFEAFGGIPEMSMLNEMDYDAWVIGNNDFRVPEHEQAYGKSRVLEQILEKAKAPALCANVTSKQSGSYLKKVKPYIVKEINGVRIGIIGVTSVKPQKRGYEPDKVFSNAVETLKKCVEELKGKTDVNIVLSHCGLSIDVKLSEVPGIAAVLGADDHFIMPTPIYWVWEGEKSVPIVQHGGEEKHMLGRLDLVFQKKGNALKMVDFRGNAYDTDFVRPDEKVQKILEDYKKQLKKKPVLQEAA